MGPSYETQFTVCYIYSCDITLVGIELSNVGKTTYGCLRRLIAGEQEYFYMLKHTCKVPFNTPYRVMTHQTTSW